MSTLSVALASNFTDGSKIKIADIDKEMDLIDRGIDELSNFLDSVTIKQESKKEDANKHPES